MSTMIERVARALIRDRGGELTASDVRWPQTAARYYEMCAKFPDYGNGGSLVTDAFRDARTAIEAMREADDPMLLAGLAVVRREGEVSDPLAGMIWRAMIDGALSEPTSGGRDGT